MKTKALSGLVMLLCLTSCGWFWRGSEPTVYQYFLPGECLSSTELTFESSLNRVEKDRLIFVFRPAISDYDVEEFKYDIHRYVPSQELLKAFGKNKDRVAEAYVNTFDKCYSFISEKLDALSEFSVLTALYSGDLSLTADRDFAGIKAGANLAPMIIGTPFNDSHLWGKDAVIADGSNLAENLGRVLDLPEDYECLLEADMLAFSIPIGDNELIEETVNFEMKIPVRVVNYLQWLNDRISDPDAPVPYKEEVLHCRFSTKFHLRQ